MKIRIENIKENPLTLMRRAGYVFQRKEKEQMSFVRVLGRNGYPRFHVYAHLEEKMLIVNLHLDQKRKTYGDETRHHGEYEQEGAVKKEAIRIENAIG